MSFTRQDQIDDAAFEGRYSAICAEADAILDAEGEFYVNRIGYASADAAFMARMVEAKKRVALRDEWMLDYWHQTKGSRV